MSGCNDNDNIDTDDIKCCGSGCNICVLDTKKPCSAESSKCVTKPNLLTIEGNKYVSFALDRKSKCTENVWRFKFTYVNKDHSSMELYIPPGRHLMLRAISENGNPRNDRHDQTTDGNFISRPYTPINVDKLNGKFEILVKFEPNGLMSKYLDNLVVGDVIEVKGSYGSFEWIPNSFRHLICISQGVAIAPMYSVVCAILDNENDETWIDFITCFRSIEDILLRDEIHNLRQYWNFNSSTYLSNESMCSCDKNERTKDCLCIRSKLKYNETVCTFRLDEIELSKIFIQKPIENCLTLICGTNRFINSIKMSLKNLHIKDENIFVFD